LSGTQNKGFPVDQDWLLMGYRIGGRKIVESGDFQRYKIVITLHNYKLGLNLK